MRATGRRAGRRAGVRDRPAEQYLGPTHPLLQALERHGPYELVYGPSGYGLPLVAAAAVGERELAEMVLVRPDESRADTGVGGSSGPLGVRAAGALDGELAYLLAPALSKRTLFTGGALDPTGALPIADLEAPWSSPAHADGWTALLESATKAIRGLVLSVPAPHAIVVSGRLARLPGLVAALASSLGDDVPCPPRRSRCFRRRDRAGRLGRGPVGRWSARRGTGTGHRAVRADRRAVEL